MSTPARLSKRPQKAGERPAFTRDDASFLLEFPVMLVTTALAPERHWQRVALRMERVKSALSRFSPEKIRRGLRLVRGEGQDGLDDALCIAATRSEHHMQIIRDRFFGWRAPLLLEGREHLDAALAEGRGAILWVAHFSFNALATKKAIHEAGFSVAHLSRPEHGFSKSRFGLRFLNPLRSETELRYLSDRVIIDRTRPASAVLRAQKILKGNGIISITAGAWEGASIATVVIHGSLLDLSTGAPGLAAMTGAALLPVVTLRDEGSDAIRVTVGAPIPVERGRGREDTILSATQTFADRIAPFVKSHPFQWRDWEKVRPA